VIYLTIENICEINKEWITIYGGRYEGDNNFLHKESLEYILNAIQNKIYGVDRYPSLIDKAAALALCIIGGHVFNDGNKRTGMQAAIELLEINGAIISIDSESIVKIALKIAENKISLEELSEELSHFVNSSISSMYIH
jgi:death on curing protein